MTTTILNFHHHDIPRILDIDSRSHWHAWSGRNFGIAAAQPSIVIRTARDEACRLTGFMVVERYRGSYEIHRMAVHPAFQRRGHGTRLIENLAGRLSTAPGHPRKIAIAVDEQSLDSHLFLRRLGFRCVSQFSETYHGQHLGMYRFELRVGQWKGHQRHVAELPNQPPLSIRIAE